MKTNAHQYHQKKEMLTTIKPQCNNKYSSRISFTRGKQRTQRKWIKGFKGSRVENGWQLTAKSQQPGS